MKRARGPRGDVSVSRDDLILAAHFGDVLASAIVSCERVISMLNEGDNRRDRLVRIATELRVGLDERALMLRVEQYKAIDKKPCDCCAELKCSRTVFVGVTCSKCGAHRALWSSGSQWTEVVE